MTHKHTLGIEGSHGLDLELAREGWHGLTRRWCKPERKHGHAVLEGLPRLLRALRQEDGVRKDATLKELRDYLEASHVEVTLQDGRSLRWNELLEGIPKGQEVGGAALVLLGWHAVDMNVDMSDRLEARPRPNERNSG